ncbi:MAG: hypothetical protein OXE02_03410 [Chloroflexi bacterium]|nr:hypothetical protein [Chloroflexota bacterium]
MRLRIRRLRFRRLLLLLRFGLGLGHAYRDRDRGLRRLPLRSVAVTTMSARSAEIALPSYWTIPDRGLIVKACGAGDRVADPVLPLQSVRLDDEQRVGEDANR